MNPGRSPMKLETLTTGYVVPMVFPDDLKWRHDYATANGMYRDDRSALTNVRFRSWGTEHLLIRCIRKNLPWIRDIIILLARKSQIQQWMLEEIAATTKGMPRVRIVLHGDFIPDRFLPTFNSRAIEMFLHRIPDLAPQFLYGNDDMFPLAPLCEEHFYKDGLPRLHYTRKRFDAANTFHMACMNGMNFVAGQFGLHFQKEWLHLGHNVVPVLRETCEKFWSRHRGEMEASVTRFREPRNYNQYIYSWWHILSGLYDDYRMPGMYVSDGNTMEEIVCAIRTADGLLCINDRTAAADFTSIAATVRREISLRL